MIGVLLACTAPTTSTVTFDLLIADAIDVDAAAAQVVEDATYEVRAALPAADDTTVALALADRAAAGVDVRLVTDIDVVFPALEGVDHTQVDAGLELFDFDLNTDVAWPSTDVVMSDAFAIVDRRRLFAATALGTGTGLQLAIDVTYEDVAQDVEAEHVQLHGGVDATSTDAYDALNKSIADPRWSYPLPDGSLLELWCGPQERLVKRLIDGVFAARGDIVLLSDDVADEALILTLQEKAETGFGVTVVTGSGFGTRVPSLSALLDSAAPDVLHLTVAEPLPTVLWVPPGARGAWPRALVLTHPALPAVRTVGGAAIPSDQFVDGLAWGLLGQGGRTPALDAIEAAVATIVAGAEDAP